MNENITCSSEDIIDIVSNIIHKSLDGVWEHISKNYLDSSNQAKDTSNYLFDKK